MDWRDLAGSLVKAGAPIIGGALGGPLGGMLGSAAGKIIADALGADPTPEAVNEVLTKAQADPAAAQELADKLKIAEENFAAAMAKVGVAEVQEIGASERAELVSGDRFQKWWRPLIGYVTAYLVAFFGSVIGLAMIQAMATGKLDTMNAIFAGITSIVFFLSVPGSITGATSIGRSFEKVTGLKIGEYGKYVAGATGLIGKVLGRK